MKIRILRRAATETEIRDMLETLQTYIKLAVDVERGVLAGVGSITPTVRRSCWRMEAFRRTSGVPIGTPIPGLWALSL